MPAAEAIVLQEATKRYGGFAALDRVSLHVPQGAFLLLAGANGAGKSTLLRLLSGLCRPTEGTVLVGGDAPHRSVQARRRIGLLSHHSLLYDDLSAQENLRFFARLYGVEDAQERVDRVLEETGLELRRDQRVGSFSRGMKQRLSLARALLHHPQLLLLDEPYTGLDQRAATELSQRLEALRGTTTVVLVTHHMDEAVRLADRLVLLRRGRLRHQQRWDNADLDALRALYEEHLEERL